MANIHRYLQSPDSKNVHLFFSFQPSLPWFFFHSGCEFLLPFHISNIYKRKIAYRSQQRRRGRKKKNLPCVYLNGHWHWLVYSGPNYPLIGIDVFQSIRNFCFFSFKFASITRTRPINIATLDRISLMHFNNNHKANEQL